LFIAIWQPVSRFGGTTTQWQDRFRRARGEWMLLTFYERFEQVVILILTGLIAIAE
jgi:hypothetical protein